MVKVLLKLDTIRGPHSTGLLGVTKQGVCNIFKKVGTPWELEEYKGWDTFWGRQHAVLIGHNRHATQGAINHVNAHPYEHGYLYGVHNGSLTNKWKLEDSKDFDVDSDNLYHHMLCNGLEHTVKRIEGAFALVWYDETDKTINFVRNKERPLHMAYSKDGKTLFWASEGWMLLVAADKANVQLEKSFALDVGVHAAIPVDNKGIGDAINTAVEFALPKAYGGTSGNTYKGKKSNLVPAGKQGTTCQSPVYKYVGKHVIFEVLGVDEDPRSKLDYLDGCMEEEDIDVRVYMDCESSEAASMLAGLCSYEGRVTHCSFYGGAAHLVINSKGLAPVAVAEVLGK